MDEGTPLPDDVESLKALLLERDAALEERHRALLEAFGLPVRVEKDAGVGVEDVLQAMLSDKKVVGGRPRWVLLQQVGEPVVRSDVSPDLVRDVVTEVVAAD